MIQKNLYFFIPVEITNRELDYKVNISRYFCNLGFDILLGNPPYLRDELKYKNYKGIFIEKGANPDPTYYKSLRDKGIYLYDLSDEGLGQCVYNINYSPVLGSLSYMRKIFFWGEAQRKEFYDKSVSNDVKEKMYSIGNPSFDLSFPNYKPMYIALKPPKLPKNYILVNMNFSALFGYSIELHTQSCPNMAPQTLDLIVKEQVIENMQWPIFREWLEDIIKSFPEEQFLIRPHPTEILDNYKLIFGKYKNVLISKDGNVNYVIASAKLVLHKDCLTAMQSYLMEVPSISLGGENLFKNYAQWPLYFSVLPKNLNEAKLIIFETLRLGKFNIDLQKEVDKKAKTVLDQYFTNLGESTKALVEFIITDSKELIKNFSPYTIVDSRKFLQKIKLFVRKNMPLHYKVPKASQETLVEFTKKDVVQRLDLLESIQPSGSKFNVKKIFPNVFKISKK